METDLISNTLKKDIFAAAQLAEELVAQIIANGSAGAEFNITNADGLDCVVRVILKVMSQGGKRRGAGRPAGPRLVQLSTRVLPVTLAVLNRRALFCKRLGAAVDELVANLPEENIKQKPNEKKIQHLSTRGGRSSNHSP